MSFFGENTFRVLYPIETPTVNYSVEQLRCRVESKSKAELFKIYDVEKEIYIKKFGNRWEYKIIIVNPTQDDLDTLDSVNGKLVLFFPHTDNYDAYECWLWYWYDDATPHKDRIYVHLIRKTLDSNNELEAVVVPDFQAYYPFTYGSIYDYSGNSNILTNNNASITNGVKAIDYNGGYSFNGVDSYMSLPFDRDNYSEFTISMWIKTDGSTDERGIFQWANGLTASIPFFLIQYNAGNLRFFYSSGYRYTVALPLDQWVFIAVRRSQTTGSWKFTINTTTHTDLQGITYSGSDMYFGNGWNGYMGMDLDNIRFYTRAITNEEITEIYNSEKV